MNRTDCGLNWLIQPNTPENTHNLLRRTDTPDRLMKLFGAWLGDRPPFWLLAWLATPTTILSKTKIKLNTQITPSA